MSTDRDDDRWGDNRDVEAPMDPADFRRAQRRVSLPAKLLVAGAVFMMLLAGFEIAVAISGYDWQLKMLEYLELQQPPGQPRDDFKKHVDELRNRDRTPEFIQAAVSSALGLTLDAMILFGGFKMHSLRGRTLATVGAVCAIIPVNSCFCIGIPFGIWALVVLFDPNVKAAFEARKRDAIEPMPNDDLR